MCGFYSRDEISKDDFKKIYGVEDPDPQLLKSSLAIRPKSVNTIVTRNSPSQAVPMIWWFHPGWATLPENRGVINARIESIKTHKPYFKKAFLSQRCLIPATAWVEWKEIDEVKLPHVFRFKNIKPFAFAGLWSTYTNKSGKEVRGYCIITGTPNQLARTIHNRQPCIVRHEEYSKWLDKDIEDANELTRCLRTYPEQELEVFPVDKELRPDNPDYFTPLKKTEVSAMVKKYRISKKKAAT